jgi:hypothetical protein
MTRRELLASLERVTLEDAWRAVNAFADTAPPEDWVEFVRRCRGVVEAMDGVVAKAKTTVSKPIVVQAAPQNVSRATTPEEAAPQADMRIDTGKPLFESKQK